MTEQSATPPASEDRLCIGLTGGIASGKSAVSARLAELGAGIVDTDAVAREVVMPGTPGLEQVIECFGQAILLADGTLNRAALRDRIFADGEAKADLEAILHPLIRSRTLKLAAVTPGPYLVFVVPLLFESGFDALVDRVLVVDCPPELQLERLMQRDQETEESARRAIAGQLDRDTRNAQADDLIDNSGTLAELLQAVDALHVQYLDLAAARTG
jgi:dephospho-CoA kinase